MNGVILFDLDGVLANFIRAFTRVGHEIFGTPVSDAPAHEVWMFEDFPELNLDKAKCTVIWGVIKNDPDFWANLDCCNLSVMWRVNAIQNKIFVTNRPGIDPLSQSYRFLQRWGIEDPTVIVVEHKAPVAEAEGVIAMTDDYFLNCAEVKAALPSAYVTMMRAPYNKCHDDAAKCAGIDVVLSVDHFINECDKRGLTVY